MKSTIPKNVTIVILAIVGTLLLLTLLAAALSATSAHAATGGGWSTDTSATNQYWGTVSGHTLPCRTASRWVHKWGVSGVSGDTFDAKLQATACLARPAGHNMFIYSLHWTPTADACQWSCSVDLMTFSASSWGCWGAAHYGCISAGHSNTWKMSHGYDLLGLHEHWYPKISITFKLLPWAPGRGNIGYSSSASCPGC